MKNFPHIISVFIFGFFLSVGLCSCGGSTTRYNPGPASVPSNLAVAGAGGGQVLLTWSKAYNADAYNVYYSTSSGFTPASGTKFATTKSTSVSVTGLSPSTTYYFLVTSVNAAGESPASGQVFAITPADNAPFAQTDLVQDSLGNNVIWNFNILVSGTNPGWMRGNISVDSQGNVTFNSFLDSSNNTTAPTGLFPMLTVNSAGQVMDVDVSNAKSTKFHGLMSSRRNMIIGTLSLEPASPMLIILQKHSPSVTFSLAGDIQGFGNTSGGARRFIYNQVSTGSAQEWEYAMGQIGSDARVQYSSLVAPSNPILPGSDHRDSKNTTKVSTLAIDPATGIVTETRGVNTALPAPSVFIPAGVMSDDKSVIVAVATDTSSGSNKYLLRIYQMINILPISGGVDPNPVFALSDLVGTYGIRNLQVGTSNLWATGAMTVDSSGSAVFSAFADSNGGSVSPAGISLGITTDGILSNSADTTFHGKLSYFKDMIVFTRTESAGNYSLSVGIK
jgi:hypothetical protein